MQQNPEDTRGIKQLTLELQRLAIEAKTSIGTAVELQNSVVRSFAEVQRTVGRFAFTLNDVSNLQSTIGSQMKTNFLLSVDTSNELLIAGKAIGEGAAGIGKIANDFYDAGFALSSVGESLQTASDISRQFGVNTRAVVNDVTNNLKNANQFGFNTGVDGLTRMAAQAAALRSNMSFTFDFAKKVFDPEGAIEAVNTFQRLGVAVGDLGDPCRLMFLAQNDVEGLQNEVLKVTEQFGFLNTETGRFQFSPEGVRTVKELENTLGISYDKIFQLSKAQAQLDAVSKELRPLGNIDEESKQLIAGMADFNKEKGGFTVNIKGTEKLVSQLSADDLIQLKETQEPKTLESIAEKQLTISEAQRGLLSSINDTLLAGVAISPGQLIAGVLTDAQSGLSKIVRDTISPTKVADAGPQILTTLTDALRRGVSGESVDFSQLSETLRNQFELTQENANALIQRFQTFETGIETSIRERGGGDYAQAYRNVFNATSSVVSSIRENLPSVSGAVGAAGREISGALTHNVNGTINLNLQNATTQIDPNSLLNNSEFVDRLRGLLSSAGQTFGF